MTLDKLKDPDLLIVFTSAPAGLGHLRVTDALQEGLPKETSHFLLSSTDPTITYLHRLSSINPVLRQIQYLVQYHPLVEQLFANLYRSQQRSHTSETYNQLLTLLNIHHSNPKRVLIIATHFGLAHKIAEIKNKLEKKTKIKIKLYVVVTDDTFQKVWAVDGADIIFVPSKTVKRKYEHYFVKKGFKLPKFIVNPYPLSQKLLLSSEKLLLDRKKQLSLESKIPTQLLIPISGAAVQLKFFQKIIPSLCRLDKPFKITVVSKLAPFTRTFLNHLNHHKNLELVPANTDRATVDLYEEVFLKTPPPVLEITKPSEQAFKALLKPNQVGGVILLFSNPIGKQEEDNLDFLLRHNLTPDISKTSQLHQLLTKENPSITPELFKKAKSWRALTLPQHSQQSILFIKNARQLGLFKRMLKFSRRKDPVISCLGVEKFWQNVSKNL